MNLEKLSIEELKAMAYDNMVTLQRVQNNLQVINQAIVNKQQEEMKKNKSKPQLKKDSIK